MSFGTRLKERRECLGMTQTQLAKLLGVSKGSVGNYETDANSPRTSILYKLFRILQCDANYLFQDEMDGRFYQNCATPEEFEAIVKKFRSLDSFGQETVSLILDREYARASQISAIRGANLSVISEEDKAALDLGSLLSRQETKESAG